MKKGFGVVLLLVSLGLIAYGTYLLFEDKEFTVEFNGIENSYVEKVKKNSYVKRPIDPVKTGYKFDGWYYNGNLFSFDSKITSNIILEAKWTKTVVVDPNENTEFTVKFKNEDGDLISETKVKKGTVVEKPDDPTKEGYKFIGWYNKDNLYDFNLEVTSNLVLTSKFEKIITYTVTFNSDGGSSIKSVSVEDGKTVTKPANPTKKDYTFVSWQLDGKDYNFSSNVTKDITLKATWKKIVKHLVQFNTNGGNSIGSISVEDGKTATKPANPTKKGNTFSGWQLDGKDYNFNSKVTKDIILVAKWIVNSYTVSFDTNGGSPIDDVVVEYGKTIERPNDPVNEGYTFVGWQLNGKDFDFSTAIESNIVLVAVWEEEK